MMNYQGLQKKAKNTTINEKTGKFNKKKRFEPYGQEKILKFLRDWGLILLSVGIILIALSVAWVFVPRSASSIL